MTEGYLDHDLLARLSNIPLEARHGMSGNVSGRHRSINRGSSVEFAEYRKYVSGDDTKRLDWKAFARSDKFFVKEYEADTNLRAYMFMDCSGSMGFASDEGESKYVRACRMAANLSYLAIGQGDAVGMVFSRERQPVEESTDNITGKGIFLIPPSRRPAHLRVLLHQMASMPTGGTTTLIDDLNEFAERVPRRGVVMIFSDLFVDTEKLRGALRHLKYRRHDVAVFHFVDDIEIGLTIDRPVRFVDMEGNTAIVSEPALIRDEYMEIVREYLSDAKRACMDVNADYFLIRRSDSWKETVTRFLTGRIRKKK